MVAAVYTALINLDYISFTTANSPVLYFLVGGAQLDIRYTLHGHVFVLTVLMSEELRGRDTRPE